MNKRTIGSDYENKACEFLETQGFSVLERNFRCRQGEIDIVAREGRYLVFVEVKYRATSARGTPISAVNYRKQRKISSIALYYLTKNAYPETTPCRFDVVGISPGEVVHIRNAFDYVP